jgi:hypothetical protein
LELQTILKAGHLNPMKPFALSPCEVLDWVLERESISSNLIKFDPISQSKSYEFHKVEILRETEREWSSDWFSGARYEQNVLHINVIIHE